MTMEKPRDEYMRDATQFLNSCEKSMAEDGGSSGSMELLLLTRGESGAPSSGILQC